MINYTTPTKAQNSKRPTTTLSNTTCTPTTPNKKRPRSHLHPNVHAAAHQATPSLSPPHDRRPSKTLRVNIHGARVASSRGVQQPRPPITPPASSASATPTQTHYDNDYYEVATSRSTSCPTKKPLPRAHAHARVQSKKARLGSKKEERTRTRTRERQAAAKRRLQEHEQEREQEQQAREERDRAAYEIMQREREVLEFAESRAFAFAGGGACLPTPVRTPSSLSGYATERWMISEEEEEMVSEEDVKVDGVVSEEKENSREEEAVHQAWLAELESQKRAFEADCARKLQETEDLLLTRFAQLQAAHEADNARYIAQFDAVKQSYAVEKQNAAEELEAMSRAIVMAIANANATAQNEEVARLRAELERARVGAEEMERRANEVIEAELGRMQEAERLRRKEASERATEEMMRFRAQALEEVRREQKEGKIKREELERLAQQLAADKETLMNEKRQFFAQQERPMSDASMHSICSDASMDTVAPPAQEEDPTTLIQFFAQRASLLSNFKHATHHPSFTLSFNCVPWPVLKYQRDVTSSLHITRAEIDQFFTHPERPLALGYQPDTLMQWKADRSAWHSDKVVPVLRRWLDERRRDLGDFQDSGRADAVIEEIEQAMAVVFCYLDDKVKAVQVAPRPGN